MIKQIMICEVTDNVANYRDDITMKITQDYPIPVIDKYRIVKSGNRQDFDNSQYVILETYRNIVINLFNNYRNCVRYRQHNNNYIINNF